MVMAVSCCDLVVAWLCHCIIVVHSHGHLWSVVVGGDRLLLGRGDMVMATVVCLVVVGC